MLIFLCSIASMLADAGNLNTAFAHLFFDAFKAWMRGERDHHDDLGALNTAALFSTIKKQAKQQPHHALPPLPHNQRPGGQG